MMHTEASLCLSTAREYSLKFLAMVSVVLLWIGHDMSSPHLAWVVAILLRELEALSDYRQQTLATYPIRLKQPLEKRWQDPV